MKLKVIVAIASLMLVFACSVHASAAEPIVVLEQDDDIYEMVANAEGVVIVDFYADWCGPCRKQSGILHEMQEFAKRNRASIIKVNVDQHKKLAKRFSVSSLPTLMVVKDGKILERKTGVADHKALAEFLKR